MTSPFLLPLALLLQFQSAPTRPAMGAAERPLNVLLIVVDDLGVDHVDWHPVGQASFNPAPTPFLSSMATTSLIFTQAYASPICGPTRASLLTGRYPFRHGLGANPVENEPQLAVSETTLPELLALAGYRCGGFGKWGVSTDRDDPNVQGFDYFDGTIGGLKGGGYYNWLRVINGNGFPEQKYATTVHTNSAIKWIQAQGQRHWFAYVSYTAPHKPFEPPPAELNPLTGAKSTDPDRLIYQGMIEAVDHEVKRLVKSVDLDRTLVIFVGDNGAPQVVAQAPVATQKAKFTAYEGGILVPAMAWGRTVDKHGQVDGLVHVVDLFETILDAAGAPHSPAITDSVSLLDPLAPAAMSWLPRRDELFTERFEPTGAPPFGPHTQLWRVIRDSRYKLHRTLGGDELYDLQVDPWEDADLLLGLLTPGEQQAYAALDASMNALLGS